jgi:hypothetical protein
MSTVDLIADIIFILTLLSLAIAFLYIGYGKERATS